MSFDVLPGPSLPELARTALARAAAATISDPDHSANVPVPVRAGRDGTPLLLPATGSLLERRLAEQERPVTVSVPASLPYAALRLTGTARPASRDRAAGITLCTVAVRSAELTGTVPARVPVDAYRAATPDPLWREAPSVLHHLEQGHMADLVGCIRAHGMPGTDWVIPRGLDRYGLELLVLSGDGVAAVRLSFPDGPVTCLEEVPASIRTVFTCRCQAEPDHHSAPNR